MIRFFLITFLSASMTANSQDKGIVYSDQQFINFLEKSLGNSDVDAESRRDFNQRSRAYWMDHMLDYNQNPEKYSKAISLFHQNQLKYKQNNPIKIDRFENQIENFRRFDKRNSQPPNPVLFIGSSSIVFWETAKSFPDLPVINRGFGGASLAEIIHYYDDVIKKHSPSILIVYCDIDIERGESPSVAMKAFKELVNKVHEDFPQTQIILLSMKPTLIDDFIGKDVRKNKAICNQQLNAYCEDEDFLHYIDISHAMFNSEGSLRSDIFLADGMHLNALGYTLWDPLIRSKIMELTHTAMIPQGFWWRRASFTSLRLTETL